MNNFMVSARRIITNKNTVTIVGVIVILAILYMGYNSTINNAVNPVKVPVAANLIGPQTEITVEDVKWIEVPSISKPSNVILQESQIVGKYTDINATIPEGSMFYADVLVEKDDLPGTWLTKLKADVNGVIDTPAYINVNVVSTYGNSIQPDDYIDLYMKAQDESKLIMYGKLLENVQILAVKDSSGEDVFSGSDSDATPSYLYFGLSEELYVLYTKALYLEREGVELVVVPHGGVVPVTGDVLVSSEYLKDYIIAHSIEVPTNQEWMDENLPANPEEPLPTA
jgi:hypothetical protein